MVMQAGVNRLQHILVGTDFSEASRAALDAGRNLARAAGARLTLLHVCPPGVDALGAAGLEQGMAMGHRVHEALAVLKDRLTGVPDSRVELVTDPSPAAALVDFAASHEVDLIVVGSHGRGAAGRFLLGSVADRVARHAGCSVLVARTGEAYGGGQGS